MVMMMSSPGQSRTWMRTRHLPSICGERLAIRGPCGNKHTHTFKLDNIKLVPTYDSLNHITAHDCNVSLFSVSEDKICARPHLDT